jgi:hypothetical protein
MNRTHFFISLVHAASQIYEKTYKKRLSLGQASAVVLDVIAQVSDEDKDLVTKLDILQAHPTQTPLRS